MAKLTNKEIDILVKRLTKEVKEASLQKLEEDMKRNADYQEVKSAHMRWSKTNETQKELRIQFDNLKNSFNSKCGVDWKLDTDYDGIIAWYYNGDRYSNNLYREIEQELVYQMIDKDNDMEAVTKAIINKFSIQEDKGQQYPFFIMKKTMNEFDFVNDFTAIRPNNFTREALYALFNWIEQLDADTGEETEFDPIAICCDFTEYNSLAEVKEAYDDIETIENLQDKTIVIEVPETDRLITHNFQGVYYGRNSIRFGR